MKASISIEVPEATVRFVLHRFREQAGASFPALLGKPAVAHGARAQFGPASNDERERVIALHSCRTSLEHPMTREPIRVEAPLPEAWRELPLPLPWL